MRISVTQKYVLTLYFNSDNVIIKVLTFVKKFEIYCRITVTICHIYSYLFEVEEKLERI